MNYFKMQQTDTELNKMSSLALAHVGDAVFELMVRTRIAWLGKGTARNFHKEAVKLVAAPAQANGAEKILHLLTAEETAVFKRGRNAKVNSVPKASSLKEYHEATALEALFGYLYLRGCTDRLNELFNAIMEDE